MSNALFITEGLRPEKQFFEGLWKTFGREVEIFPYKANIHSLIKYLFVEDRIDENIDPVQYLISIEKDPYIREKLNKKFTDVFLVFDMDMHHSGSDINKLEAMLKFFCDPADEGKLYINYPMMESYRHFTSFNDDEFKGRTGKCSPEYKETVGNECCNELKDVKKYNEEIFRMMIGSHLKKANYILNGAYMLPSKDEFLRWDGADILKIQYKKFQSDGSVYVLNTSIFNAVDYRPSDFLE